MDAPQWDLSIAYSGISDPNIANDIGSVRTHIATLLGWQDTPDDTLILQQVLGTGEQARIVASNLEE